MRNVFLPPKLEVHSGNLSKEWKQWRQVWDAYEEVTDLRNNKTRLRVATFITCIGKEALKTLSILWKCRNSRVKYLHT